MRTTISILFCLICSTCFSQQDTVVNKKHYNTVIYYPYFDYKVNDTIKNNYVVAIGNTIDSTKVGEWTYYLSDGKILAQGKYKKGFKRGRWSYMDDLVVLIWEKSAMAKDYVRYDLKTKRPEIVDVVDTKFTSYKVVNGRTIYPPHVIYRFL